MADAADVTGIDIGRDAAHDAAKNELAKPIYPKDSLSQQFLDWVHELLRHLLVQGSKVPGGWFTIAVLLIVLAAAAATAIRIARNTLRTRRGGDHQLFGPTVLSAAAHRASAEAHAAAGDWAAAIRHRLRAVARQLEESAVLGPVPGRTANELAHDAGAALPRLSTELSNAANTFNDVTYGSLPGTEAGYRKIVDLDDHLRSGAPDAASIDAAPTTATWAHVR